MKKIVVTLGVGASCVVLLGAAFIGAGLFGAGYLVSSEFGNCRKAVFPSSSWGTVGTDIHFVTSVRTSGSDAEDEILGKLDESKLHEVKEGPIANLVRRVRRNVNNNRVNRVCRTQDRIVTRQENVRWNQSRPVVQPPLPQLPQHRSQRCSYCGAYLPMPEAPSQENVPPQAQTNEMGIKPSEDCPDGQCPYVRS